MAVSLLQLNVNEDAEKIRDYFPFLYRLYLVTSKSQYAFVRWAYDGVMLQVDYIGLQLHLVSQESVFPDELNVTQFLKRLRYFNFQKIEIFKTPRPTEIWVQYYHRCFQAGHLNLIKNMVESKHFSWSARTRLQEMRSRLEHAINTSIFEHQKLLSERQKRKRGKQSRLVLSFTAGIKTKLLKRRDHAKLACKQKKNDFNGNKLRNESQFSVAPLCASMITETPSKDELDKEINETVVSGDFLQIYTNALNILLEN